MGKPDIRPATESKTPDPIEIKFGTVDYGEGTRHAKFYANPSKAGFPANG